MRVRRARTRVDSMRSSGYRRILREWNLMFAPLMLSLSLTFTPAVMTVPDPATPAPVASQKQDRQDSGREWALNRPSRGAHGSVVRDAATIPRSLRPWAACVLDRESGGTLDRRSSGQGARNPSSSAAGRWQFLDNSWRRGLSFMVRDRLVEFGMPRSRAREVRLWLERRNISEWPGWYQDIGFLAVVERGGRHHWNGGSHSC